MDAGSPSDPRELLAHLDANAHEAAAVQWTLTLEGVPVYVLEPTGPFASDTYELLRRFLREQLEDGVERVSIAGTLTGVTRHRSGAEIPVVAPVLQGMYSWTTEALVDSVVTAAQESGEADVETDAVRGGVTNFLDRVYFELRNVGQQPHERAVNYAATNALEAERIYEQALRANMELDTIEVEPSVLSPPGTNCWDVRLTFFSPDQPTTSVRRVYRYTVDVADVVPSTVGTMRSWSIR
jgi:cyanobactin maturation PatA/PatG family protease